MNIFKSKKLLVVIILLSILSLFYFFTISKRFKKDFQLLNEARQYMLFQYPFIQYYYTRGKCADSFDNIFEGLPTINTDSIKRVNYKDILAKGNTQIMFYLPLFNQDTIKDAFIIVSAGIDGRVNNKFNLDDTIFKKELLSKFQFYNEDLFYDEQPKFSDDTINNKFCLYKYLFGKKDYLVCYVDLPKWD